MKKTKKQWIDQYYEVIANIEEKEFSSHDFIGKFCKLNEKEWKQLLARHETKAIQKVNAYLSRMLSLYASELPVQKMPNCKMDKNMHASSSQVHWWKKIKKM